MTAKAAIPFLVGMMLLTGVCNTLLTKYQDQQCVADCDTSNPKLFEQPVIQTLQMFIGESGCWLVVLGSYLFQRFSKSTSRAYGDVAYKRVGMRDSEDSDDDDEARQENMSSSQTLVDPTNVVAKPLVDGEEAHTERLPLVGWRITLLALPAVCDICGTTLMNVGLLFVAASIYQMTRGALVLFVGLFSVLFLKRHLGGWKWTSLFVVVLGVAVVGLAGALEQKQDAPQLPGDSSDDAKDGLLLHSGMHLFHRAIDELKAVAKEHAPAETIFGVLLIAGAQIFTATQFVLEESIMERYALDPIKVVGWEGLFGFLVTLVGIGILHTAVGQTAAGQGSYFDARAGFSAVFHNRAIAVSSVLIMFSIGGFNYFGLSVTRSISATSRSTIDTCRTLFIWMVSLGLGWETFKWLQVLGFALLVWGTGVFNEIVQPPTISFLRRKRIITVPEDIHR